MPIYELKIACPSCRRVTTIVLAPESRDVNCPGCQLHTGLSIATYVGAIYVLSNPAMPGLLKIGMTERDVRSRASELSAATGVPEGFVIEAYFLVNDPRTIESEVHNALAPRRKSGREFFEMDVLDALSAISRIANRQPDFVRKRNQSVEPLTSTAMSNERSLESVRLKCRHCGSDYFANLATDQAISKCPNCNMSHLIDRR